MQGDADIGEFIGMVIALIAVLYTLISTILQIAKGKQEDKKPIPDIYKEIFQQDEDEEEEIEEEEIVKIPPKPAPAVMRSQRMSAHPEEGFFPDPEPASLPEQFSGLLREG